MPDKRMVLTLAIMLTVAPVRAEEAPDIEMIEYLGSWETANGKYIDPAELQAEDVADAGSNERASDAK